MGLFGKIGSLMSKASTTVVNVAKKTGRYVKEKVTNVWNKFSGKEKFEEADRQYDEIASEYRRKSEVYQQKVQTLSDKIEGHVHAINEYKRCIKHELLVQMAVKVSKIKDVSVSREFTLDAYQTADISFDSIRSKEQLYLIDFNKSKFKTSFLAVVTLGFYTRKKAKETLLAVQEETAKLRHEMEKMNAEISKLQQIETSLAQVEGYFKDLIEIYNRLLTFLDGSVKFLYFRSLKWAHKLLRQEMSIRHLSKVQQREIEAIITASHILKAMVETRIVSVGDKNEIVKFEKDLRQQRDEVQAAYDVA